MSIHSYTKEAYIVIELEDSFKRGKLTQEEFNRLIKKAREADRLAGDKRGEEKEYEIYIKSHCEVPDYEDQVSARSKKEAIQKFLNRGLLHEWDEKMIEPYVREADKLVWDKRGEREVEPPSNEEMENMYDAAKERGEVDNNNYIPPTDQEMLEDHVKGDLSTIEKDN